MKTAIKLLLISGALLIPAPLSSAEQGDTMQVAIKYDRTAPVDRTYNKARAIARKACKINGRVAPMKRLLEETCVAPIIAQFVLQTENQELIAYYERRMGEPPAFVPFVAD
ncbi:MAG: hypothetical protein AAFQ12_00830 [Pseudomonadota bacterium]